MWKKLFKHNNISNSPYTQILPDGQNDIPLNKSFSDNLKTLKGFLSNCSDVVYREFIVGNINRVAVVIFINELVDNKLINQSIISSLMNIKEVSLSNLEYGSIIDTIKERFLEIADIEEASSIAEVIDALLNGNSVFLIDGEAKALKMKTQGWKERNISETKIEQVIRGPREAFTENISTNASQVRRKIKSPQLKFEEYIVGRLTRTKIYISYLGGRADDEVVKEVRKRIEKIDVDSILESGYIEELIEDTPYTLFPQMQHSERPDKVASAILEGRVAIFVDGTPFVLMVPATFIQFFQSSDNYYERYTNAIAVRIIRTIFVGIALLLPGLYVAIISYHKEMIPAPLYITIIQAARGVPFPIFIEALVMEIAFEALREAGLRYPGPANQTVSIVGALIIGDAAVRAGIVSPSTIIIISITGIASFSIPSFDIGYAIRILRFVLLVLAALWGLYGIMLGIIVLLMHMVSLRSFGKEYFFPIAPINFKHLKDFILRAPRWAMNDNSLFTNVKIRYRQKSGLKPEASAKEDRKKRGNKK